jgi:addiction module RelB/DinJ family antitoxin
VVALHKPSIVYTLDMKTIINLKADKEVKEEAQRIAEGLGLSLSAVVNASLKQFIRTRSLYVSMAPHMSPELERILAPIERDIKAKKNLSPAFDRAEDALAYLNS